MIGKLAFATAALCALADEDGTALLQFRTAPGFQYPENAFTKPIEQPIEKPVQKGPVQCPGSGNYCEGNQCCPGHAVSGGKTFPCPNADRDFNRCEVGALPTVLPAFVEVHIGSAAKCPGTDSTCAGNQCCPGIFTTQYKTFPCPTAERNYAGCNITLPYLLQTAPGFKFPENAFTKPIEQPIEKPVQKGPVQCPGSGNYCEGNQCCPGHAVSGGKTFPCPNADRDFNRCEVGGLPTVLPAFVEVHIGSAAKCPGTESTCAGNQCCPGIFTTQYKTFPCPTAERNYGGCNITLPYLLQTKRARRQPASSDQGDSNEEEEEEEGDSDEEEVEDMSSFEFPPNPFTQEGDPLTEEEADEIAAEIAEGMDQVFAPMDSDFQYPTNSFTSGEGGEEASMLQSAPPGWVPQGWVNPSNPVTQPAVQKGPVKCPGSTSYCDGNQCCPGYAASGGKSFPCPNADRDFNRCEAPALVQVRRRQPDSSEEEELSSDSEEPEESSEDMSTFVFPPNPFTENVEGDMGLDLSNLTEEEADEIAAAIVEGMEEEMKEETPADAQETTDASAIQTHPGFVFPENAFTKPAKGPVKCFGSENYCEGNQCCPGHRVTGGKSFPCANADADFNGCETTIRPNLLQKGRRGST